MSLDPGVADRVAREMAELCRGFLNEIAAAWAVGPAELAGPVIVSVGTADGVGVLPARVFRHAIATRASGVVLAHNHPVPTGPSEADKAVTRRLVAAGWTLGIPLLAHLVVEDEAVWDLVSGVCLSVPPGPDKPAAA